jgi:flavin reductase (DIM6/NTAB) family NADH-FMN oxidoreductase RutF
MQSLCRLRSLWSSWWAPANVSPHGPVLEALGDRIFCRVTSSKPFGWSLLVEAEVTDVQVGELAKALAWYHGAFHEVGN